MQTLQELIQKKNQLNKGIKSICEAIDSLYIVDNNLRQELKELEKQIQLAEV
jgi:hypothetical protein